MKKMGLGRGLDVLLPENDEMLQKVVQEIPIGDIDPNSDQPRHIFAEEALSQLAQSIKEVGVLQPLIVVEKGRRYRIVAGERRWRASRLAGLTTVPCVVREMDMIQQMEAALIENLQREDLNPLEEAAAIKALMQQCGYTQEAVAQRLGKSRPVVANLLRLLTLPQEVQAFIKDNAISAGHARVLAGLSTDKRKIDLARQTIANGYSVRQLEQLAAKENQATPKKAAPKLLPLELQEMETKVRETLGVKTTLTGTHKKGKIILQYFSPDELERIYEAIEKLGEER